LPEVVKSTSENAPVFVKLGVVMPVVPSIVTAIIVPCCLTIENHSV